MLKESCAGGRREREGEEMVFSEWERDDDRLKRGRKNTKVNRRSRKPKKLQQKVRPYANYHMVTLAKLTWQSPQRKCSAHKQEERELEEIVGYFLSTFFLPSLPIYRSTLKYASSTQASLISISFHTPCPITAPCTHMTTLGTAHKHQSSQELPPILICFNY